MLVVIHMDMTVVMMMVKTPRLGPTRLKTLCDVLLLRGFHPLVPLIHEIAKTQSHGAI